MNEPSYRFIRHQFDREAPIPTAHALRGDLRDKLSRCRDDQDRIRLVRAVLEAIEFKGTITEIRSLVNDPKWDDKP